MKPNPESMADDALYFSISAQLKDVIGRELITSDEIAIFELVKNSFDAHAKHVDLYFKDDKIAIVDDGKGMGMTELTQRWLRVAYSAKADGTEDVNAPRDYRSGLGKAAQAFAGAKGIGRFSCDSLGKKLVLRTKSGRSGSKVESLDVDWTAFEGNPAKDFVKVPVHHHQGGRLGYSYPHGTVLEISSLRAPWPREKLLGMKRSLARLINPRDRRSFTITIHAPAEVDGDDAVREKAKKAKVDRSSADRNVVNGRVENFVFERLSLKTTCVTVEVDGRGKSITTTLDDRGELIYKVRESNPYKVLKGVRFKLYYLNRAAKHNFKLLTGINAVSFGSVFVFRRGFRVQPYGEEGRDDFGIDRRKQQQAFSYLGTRDIIGAIRIPAESPGFEETSSRAGGLLATPAWLDANKCFMEKCFKRLETYVVGVQWPDKMDSIQTDTRRLGSDQGRSRIIETVSQLVANPNVELLEYSANFIDVFNEKSEEFGRSLAGLRAVAAKLGSADLKRRIDAAERRIRAFREAEESAREEVEKERSARERAEARAKASEAKAAETKAENLFLRSVGSRDLDHIVSLMHQIGISASSVESAVLTLMRSTRRRATLDKKDVEEYAEIADFATKRILTISRFATKANFKADADDLTGDMGAYLRQYLDQVSSVIHGGDYRLVVENSLVGPAARQFKPIELSMLIDNVLNNARKARATRVDVRLKTLEGKRLQIKFTDDGKGIGDAELDRLFEKGYTTTNGSGLGLYHVKQIVDGLGGVVRARGIEPKGFELEVQVPL